MKTEFRFGGWALLVGAVMLVASVGCSDKGASDSLDDAKESAGDALDKAKESAGEAADAVAKGGEDAVAKGKEMVEKGMEKAGDLGAKSAAFLVSMKDQLGDLEGFKDAPEKLKAAVNELIKTIEEKSEELNLPEKVQKSLATVKEKLVALKQYLDGQVEQAQVDEKVQDIMNSVKSMFGSSNQ